MKDRSVDPGAPDPGGQPPRSGTPSSLLDRLRAPGDDAAWRRLWDLYGPTVVDWCRGAGLSAEDAADVRQEVFRTVAQGIATFRRDRPGDSFRGWLYATTRRRIVDHWRQTGRQPRAAGGTDAQDRLAQLPAEGSASGAGPTDPGDLYRRCVALMKTDFEDRTWRAFWAVTLDGRSPVEVAAELGMTPGAVYVAKTRVLKRLREEFGGLL